MTRGFVDALAGAGTPVIAEIKLRSAVGDDLLGDRSVAEVVRSYREAGAACMSVVTGRWFGGNVDLLREVAALTDVPLLQKDFITRKSQLRQAKEIGASAVLLTVGLLPVSTLHNLIGQALGLGLTPFIEVADADEIGAIIRGGECVVAVNNKDITARERGAGDLDRSVGLLRAVLATGTRCAVSASGIEQPEAGARLVDTGFDGLLVGTGLLQARSPRAWFDEFDRHRGASRAEEMA